MLFTTSGARCPTGSWCSMSCGVSTPPMTTCGHGSPARGPSPPSCRSGTTSFSRRSPGVPRPARPRPPPPRSWLLHRLPPPRQPPPSLVLLPPGRPRVEGGRAGRRRRGERVVVVVLVALLLVLLVPVVALVRAQLLLLPLPLEVRPSHPSATHGQGASRCGRSMVREGASSSAPAGGHVQRCCSIVRAVVDSARSAQPAADLAWGWYQAALRSPSAPWD